jgi:uncharacterized protein YbaP (TraB family)
MARLIFLVMAMALVACDAAVGDAPMVAHPAYWIARGSKGTAFILSSVHVLGPNVAWRNTVIDDAAERAETYVFEVPNGKAEDEETLRFVIKYGRLPKGQTLQGLLSPVAQKDYAVACTLAGLQTASLDKARPWLAAVLLTVHYMNLRHLTSVNTPDDAYYAEAAQKGKNLVYFDTTRDQLEFVSRYDQVEVLSAMLGNFAKQPERIDYLIATWSDGDTATMAKLIDRAFQDDPEGAKIFAERNREWATRLEHLLDTGGSYFVVVGIAHLVGPSGLPAILRADGYNIKGP